MKGDTGITRIEQDSNNRLVARVPRNDLIGRQAQKVRDAIMRTLQPDTQRPFGVREILRMKREDFQGWWMRVSAHKTDAYYEYCRAEALRLQALDAYYYDRATTTKELAELTDEEWNRLDAWDAYLLAPELEQIPFEKHKSIITQVRDRIRATLTE